MKKILLISYILSIVLLTTGLILSLNQSSDPGTVWELTMIPVLIFSVLAAYEISSSRRLRLSEKIMLILGLLTIFPLAGAIYLLTARKRTIP